MKSKPEQKILDAVLPRIWQPKSTDVAELALEVRDGPYKGVTYGYTAFNIDDGPAGTDGLVPCKFETRIYQAPEGFTPDESFDMFTGEVLLAWLSYIVKDAPKGD